LALFVCYFLYKHIILVVGDMIWAHQYRFRGEIAYPEYMNAAYPVAMTFFPVFFIVGMDRDLPDKVVLENPQLYLEGINRIRFNAKVFVSWVISALVHGGLAWCMPFYIVGVKDHKAQTYSEYLADAAQGKHFEFSEEFWATSCVSFTMIVVYATMRLWFNCYSPFSVQTLIAIILSCLGYAGSFYILAETSIGDWVEQPEMEGLFVVVWTTKKYLVAMALTVAPLGVEFLIYQAMVCCMPTPLDRVRRRMCWRRLRGVRESPCTSKEDELKVEEKLIMPKA
jgi:magnesium-transporting ATPase (P-type)